MTFSKKRDTHLYSLQLADAPFWAMVKMVSLVTRVQIITPKKLLHVVLRVRGMTCSILLLPERVVFHVAEKLGTIPITRFYIVRRVLKERLGRIFSWKWLFWQMFFDDSTFYLNDWCFDITIYKPSVIYGR